MIAPDAFVEHMTARWTSFNNVPSAALAATWSQLAETFNASIADAAEPLAPAADPKWRVLNPSTGTGKSQGLIVYCSMLTREAHPGVLIVVRLKDTATQAEDINALAASSALAFHSDVKEIDRSTLRDWPVLIITPAAFLRGLDMATRFQSNWSGFMALGAEGRRRLVVVDEALEIVEHAQVDLNELCFVKGMIKRVLDDFPRQAAVVKLVEDVLEEEKAKVKVKKGDGMERQLWHRFSGLTDEILQDADFTPVLAAVRKMSLDKQVLRTDDPVSRQKLVRRTERTLQGVRMTIESFAWYSRRAGMHAANSARCMIPDDAPCAVVLDATAATNGVYKLLPNMTVIEAPKGARCYDNVHLHVSRGHKVGKASLLTEARDGARRFMAELEATLHHDRKLLIVCHKDIEQHFAATMTNFKEKPAVAHWGAIDGKNQWKDYDVVAVYGLPYMPTEWAPNTLQATRGPEDTEVLRSDEFAEVKQALVRGQLTTDLIQAINRVRCRKVIDTKGNCEGTDVFLWLPAGATGDAIEAGLIGEMPGIKRLPWVLKDKPVSNRKANFGDALVVFAKNLEPGSKLLAKSVKEALGVTAKGWEFLVTSLQNPTSTLALELTKIGARYETRQEGKVRRAYLLKEA